MQYSEGIVELLARLWSHLTKTRKVQFLLLIFVTLIGACAETFSIGAVVPFLAVLTMPGRVYNNPIAQPLIQILGVTSAEQLLLPVTSVFCLAALAAGLVRLLLIWFSTRLCFAVGADLSLEIYLRTLYQPYAVHISRNSSEVISGISTKSNGIIYSVIWPVLTLISSGVILVTILIILLTFGSAVSLLAFAGFGAIYASVAWLTRAQKIKNSKLISIESTQVVKSLQEGLGAIRDVLIDGSQAFYSEIYRNADASLRVAQGRNQFIGQAPRYIIEAIGMVLIAIAAYQLAQKSDGITEAIPVLGVLALGAQRLLPAMQQVYQSWSSIQGGLASLQDTLALLEQPWPEYLNNDDVKPLAFNHQIALNDLSFRYNSNTPYIFKNLNLSIAKGARVGFIGVTGSGKSTLIDIIMGLLIPTEGRVEIDGQSIEGDNQRAWQKCIAHVPQDIFLADISIEENIAFGVPKNKIDRELVSKVARQAQIETMIESWPEGYQTLVGERGIRLSGGQKQRIGIARALYKQAEVIIFDEATSALDNETENSVMHAIETLGENLTIIIIAHRLSTLRKCSQIIELKNDGVRCINDIGQII